MKAITANNQGRQSKIRIKEVLASSGIASVLALTLVATMTLLPACTSPRVDASGPSTTQTPTVQTFQMLASKGQSVYANTCAVCHGNNGEPANKYTVPLWGNGSTLGTYHGIVLFTDAQGMLSYLSKFMPLSGGSLSHQQYIEVLSYILLKRNIVTPSMTFNESQLSAIAVK